MPRLVVRAHPADGDFARLRAEFELPQSFTAEVLRQRLVAVADQDPDHLLFFSRNHTPLTTNNVRRRLRAILDEAGIGGVTPHSFRRTVATVIDRAGGADLAAEMLGRVVGKRAAGTVARRIPVVGGVVGASADGYATWKIGRYASRELLPRAR